MRKSLNEHLDKNAGNLSTLFAVFRVLIVLGVVMGALLIGGGMIFVQQTEDQALRESMAVLYALGGLGLALMLLGGFISWRYCTLGMDWLRGLRSRVVATGEVSNTELLKTQQSLDKWLGFYIWGNLLGMVLLLPVVGYGLQALETLDPFKFNAADTPLILGVTSVVLLISFVLWIYFPTQAVRKFLHSATHRLNGGPTPLGDDARRLGIWMMVFIVLTLLSILGSLSEVFTSFASPDKGPTEAIGALVGGFFQLIWDGLCCWSFWLMRKVGLDTAELLDPKAPEVKSAE